MFFTDIPFIRLYNQHLSSSPFEKPDQVVDKLVAVQAQDFAGAKWSLALRLQGYNDEKVEQAFNDGHILRTHVMRPTWHFVTPVDIRWLLTLTAPRVHTANAHMYRKMELDEDIFMRSEREMVKALEGGTPLTRDELREGLERIGIETKFEQRMVYLLMHAELEGIICSGPRKGNQFTYMLLDKQAPISQAHEPDDPLVELTQRYLQTRGPATAQDFAKWSGLTLTDCRAGMEVVRDEFHPEEINGQVYFFADIPPTKQAPSPRIDLLSIYDEMVSAYKDHSPMGGETFGEHLAEARYAYFLLIDGQIAGGWRRTLRKREVTVELNPFRALTVEEEQAIQDEVKKYGEFLGLSAVLEIKE